MATNREQVIQQQILILSEDERESLYRFMQKLRQQNSSGSERGRELRELFRDTQALPQVQALSDDDILREVETYRNGK